MQHILSLDDAPFDKFRELDVMIVGVVTADRNLVEAVLSTRVPVDGEDVTAHIVEWLRASRVFPSLRFVMMEGITLAGLSVVDLPLLASRTGLGVIAVQRRLPQAERLEDTLRKLGHERRLEAVRASGPFHRAGRIFFHSAGVTPERAREVLRQSAGRSLLPEGIRLAHLIAQGAVLGESRGSS